MNAMLKVNELTCQFYTVAVFTLAQVLCIPVALQYLYCRLPCRFINLPLPPRLQLSKPLG